MIHRVPDDEPRRCKNLRPDQSDPYGVTRKRCTLNDGHNSACVFNKDMKPGIAPYDVGGWNSTYWNSSYRTDRAVKADR